MKRKKVALYDPYLDIMGGGEKHVLSILKVIVESDYEPTIFWNVNVLQNIKDRLNLSLPSSLSFEKNIFQNTEMSSLTKASLLSQYDVFIYVTDGSYFFSKAKQNFIFAMVPDKKLYKLNLLNRLKLLNSQFISNSRFTQTRLLNWGIKSSCIYPYLDDDFIQIPLNSLKKEKKILSVGRFFKHLHSKRQDVMINMFKKLKHDLKMLKDFELILAGGLKEEDKEYYNELVKLIGTDTSIKLKPNISYEEKLELYKKASMYWHFAGYEIDEDTHPEQTEHLGITPLEAMATGSLVFCYRAGGLKEIVEDKKTGYLFDSYDELRQKMDESLQNSTENKIQLQAKDFIKSTFSYDQFKQKVTEVML